MPGNAGTWAVFGLDADAAESLPATTEKMAGQERKSFHYDASGVLGCREREEILTLLINNLHHHWFRTREIASAENCGGVKEGADLKSRRDCPRWNHPS